MNVIKEINRINDRELALGGDGVTASWHDDYKDSAYVFVGGLPYDLTEGDVICIFSQFGEIVDINMPRDPESHKPKGFSFLMYEDQRSTVLAVDNFNGAKVLGRTIRVDHVRSYRHPDKRNEEGERVEVEEPTYNAMPPVLSDSDESSDAPSGDEEDPMAVYIKSQKRIKSASTSKGKDKKDKDKKHKHEGETKEERKARKEAKRLKKEGKRGEEGGGRGVGIGIGTGIGIGIESRSSETSRWILLHVLDETTKPGPGFLQDQPVKKDIRTVVFPVEMIPATVPNLPLHPAAAMIAVDPLMPALVLVKAAMEQVLEGE